MSQWKQVISSDLTHSRAENHIKFDKMEGGSKENNLLFQIVLYLEPDKKISTAALRKV